MESITPPVDIYNLTPGTLLRTRSVRIGLFTGIFENDNHVVWDPKNEIPITGSFIVLSGLMKWENVQGYKVLSSAGSSWLIWSTNSRFGQHPEDYVEIIK